MEGSDSEEDSDGDGDGDGEEIVDKEPAAAPPKEISDINPIPQEVVSGKGIEPESDRVSSQRLDLFRKKLSALFSGRLVDEDAIPLPTILEYINDGLDVQHMFSTEEAATCAESMTDANQIMLHDGIVYKI